METRSPQGRVRDRSTVALSVDGALLMQVRRQHPGTRWKNRWARQIHRRSPRHNTDTNQPPETKTTSDQTTNPTKKKEKDQETETRLHTVKWTP